MTNLRLVTAAEVRDAQRAIADRVRRTPMMRSAQLSERFGVEMHFKLELFQKTGSFKVRGALNRMLGLTEEERRRGVVTVSAGDAPPGGGVRGRAKEKGPGGVVTVGGGTPAGGGGGGAGEGGTKAPVVVSAGGFRRRVG